MQLRLLLAGLINFLLLIFLCTKNVNSFRIFFIPFIHLLCSTQFIINLLIIFIAPKLLLYFYLHFITFPYRDSVNQSFRKELTFILQKYFEYINFNKFTNKLTIGSFLCKEHNVWYFSRFDCLFIFFPLCYIAIYIASKTLNRIKHSPIRDHVIKC